MKKVGLLFALVLVAAACGGSDDASASAAASPTTTAATTSGNAAIEDDHEDDAASGEEGTDDHADDDHVDDVPPVDERTEDHSDDNHDTVTTSDADRAVQVAMTDFAFEPNEFEAMAGETIEFVVTNLGVVEHEFRLSNEHRIDEHIAAGHTDHDDGAEGGHHEGGDVILLVEPGDTRSVTVTFGDDTTLYSVVACLIPGHYEAGMKASMHLSA